MPKKRRQAHIPQQVRKRKPARRLAASAAPEQRAGLDGSPTFANDVRAPAVSAHASIDGPVEERGDWPGQAIATETPRRRRLEELRQRQQSAPARAAATGQLPTFERAYLMSELRRISITAGTLLALIVVLAIVLR